MTMLPKQFLALSSIFVGSWAQNVPETAVLKTTEAPSSTLEEATTNTATGTGVTTHTINVGAAGHKFTPNNITADVGDILEYRFYPDAHWVIRGDFGNPCIPYEYVGTDRTGFSSGPQPVKAITNDAPRFRVRVNNTEPIFYYCGATGSCVRYHMMGVVNPSKNETLDDWFKKANGVDYQLTPGQPFPKEQGFKTSTTSAAPESTTSTTPDSTSSSSYHHGSGNNLGSGAIAGLVIGGAALLILIIGIIYLCGRRGGFNEAYRKTFGNNAMPSNPKGALPVVEAEVGSPNSTVPGFWVYKPMGRIASSSGQSHRNSPPLTPTYNFPHDQNILNTNYYDPSAPIQPCGIIANECSASNSNDLTTCPPARPSKADLVASAELPGQKLAEPAVELPSPEN
ncbi:hypothetical protein FBEOM_14641 [Fusarium beomiforme]|uniref:Extracellular serine-rich protein n=1 Tax=Fusarium beomiforme TaxID=44412 RepID=A0A9P5DQW5_9HYPO|nr:hypothetical protein FBEOM_14641 [Fusarium beomiforme]